MSRLSTVRLLDLGITCWIVLWVVLGVVSFIEVRALQSLSDTMGVAGQSLQEAGDSLGAIASLPLVGGGLRPAAERVQTLAARTIAEAQASRTHISRLSILALVIGGVVPIGMGLGVYIPLRQRMTGQAGVGGG